MDGDSSADLPVDKTLYVGIDVGGTKVNIIDNTSETIHRYGTSEYASMEAILDDYCAKKGSRPVSVALAMAGPRDDETGAVKLTNADWPAFNPLEAQRRYAGTKFETANDMIGTVAGVLVEAGVDLEQLKPGTLSPTGTKLVLTISTGFGVAAAVWDRHSRKYVPMASEGGHIGLQPENDDEVAYLKFLQAKYPHVSAELALTGKAGIENLIDHSLEQHGDTELAQTIAHARAAGQPVGAVLLAFATEGQGQSKELAHKILGHLGNMLGSVIRDLCVAFSATGGVYMTGSIALALGEYFARETGFLQRFVHQGATHDTWIQKIPIYLIIDPHVAVKGALELAKQHSQ